MRLEAILIACVKYCNCMLAFNFLKSIFSDQLLHPSLTETFDFHNSVPVEPDQKKKDLRSILKLAFQQLLIYS